MMSKGAMGNLINKYRAVLKKCHLLNVFGSLAMAGTLVATGAIAASATEYSSRITGEETEYDAKKRVKIKRTCTPFQTVTPLPWKVTILTVD